MTRPAGGAFGPEVAPGHRDGSFGTGLLAFLLPARNQAFAPLDQGASVSGPSSPRPGACCWPGPRRARCPMRRSRRWPRPGRLDGAFGPPATLGSPVRSVTGVAALVLPSGEPAVAWADNVSYRIGLGAGELEPPIRSGRIHLARADAAATPPTKPPAARLSVPRLQRLYPDDPIRVRARCAAACDVRAFVPAKGATSAGGARVCRPAGRGCCCSRRAPSATRSRGVAGT
jgi:hypothetical protein